jgi:hypothetical protein
MSPPLATHFHRPDGANPTAVLRLGHAEKAAISAGGESAGGEKKRLTGSDPARRL